MTRRAYGLRAWLVQRVSAVYLALFTMFLVLYFTSNAPASHEEWRAWLARPAIGMASALFFIALLAHAWVGIRDVIMDYVHPIGLRVLLLALLALALLGLGFWALSLLFLTRIS